MVTSRTGDRAGEDVVCSRRHEGFGVRARGRGRVFHVPSMRRVGAVATFAISALLSAAQATADSAGNVSVHAKPRVNDASPTTPDMARALGDWPPDVEHVETGRASRNMPPGAMHAGTSQIQPGQALSLDQLEQVWFQLSPKQQFDAVEQLLRAGRPDIAERLLRGTKYHYPGDAKVARFYIALAAKGQKRHDEAISEFRALLADDPQFSRVRLELAHTLYITNQDEAARHNFEMVMGATGSSPNVRQLVTSYIGAIDGRRRWDFSAYVTIAPSTNMNQGGEAREVYLNGLPFTIDAEHAKKSGIGINAGFQGSYRHPVTEDLDIVLSGGLHTKTFRDSDFNTALATVSLGPRMKFDWGFIGLYGLIDNQWYAQESYALSFGGLLSGSVRLGARDVLYGDLTCSRRRFADDWQDTDLTHQDGHICSVSGRLDHVFDSATLLRVLGGGGRERTGLQHLDNDSWNAGVGIYRELPLGITAYLQALYTNKQYDGIYPALSEARHDRRWDLSVNLTKRDWVIWGFAPQIQYTYTINDSNVPFHEYDAHGVNVTMTKQF